MKVFIFTIFTIILLGFLNIYENRESEKRIIESINQQECKLTVPPLDKRLKLFDSRTVFPEPKPHAE